MGVPGKKKFDVYLVPDDVKLVREFLGSSRRMPGWSDFVSIFISGFADQIRDHEKKGKIQDFIEEWMIYD